MAIGIGQWAIGEIIMGVVIVMFVDFMDQIKRWIFPKKCFSCGNLLYTRSCTSCLVDIVSSAVLRQTNHRNITHFYWFDYTHRFRELLKEIKFNRDRHLLEDLLTLMRPHFEVLIDRLKPESLVEVPLHQHKLKERGFNQANVITDYLDDHHHHHTPDVFSRIENTPALFGLTEVERQKTLKEAFKLNKLNLNSPIILVDDILTTGTTLHTMKDLILKENQDAKIYFVTLSFTPAPNPK